MNHNNANKARIGIISNEQNNCNYNSSRIGIGTGGDMCGTNPNTSAGNDCRCDCDLGAKSI